MKHVLIVDDIQVNLKVLEVLLTRNGYDTTSVLSGKEALLLLQSQPVDLIISDILMPEMDGFQFCRLCKLDENLKHIPFIFYSSTHTEAKARKLARQVGAQAFVVKPADPAVLLSTIETVLSETSDASESDTQPFSEQLLNTLEDRNAQLLREKEACQALLKNIPCTVWSVDSRGHFLYISPAVEQITGFSLERIRRMGKKGWLSRIDPTHAPSVRSAYKQLFTRQTPLDITYRFQCRDGDDIWVHEKAGTPYTTRQGIPCSDGVSIDISEQKFVEEHRALQHRHLAVETFAGGVAHDFNNLVTGIAGYIELSRMAGTTADEKERFLSNALKISRNASELTRRYYTLAGRFSPSRDTQTLYGRLVDQTARDLLDGEDIDLRISIPDDLWPCRVDPDQMKDALKQILVNAKEAIPLSGLIEIVLQNVHLERTAFKTGRVIQPGHYIKTTIRDNGRGMDKDTLGRMFIPYFSTKQRDIQRGVGLGLTLSQAVITRHDGSITADAVPGRGTTLEIFLPAMAPGAQSPDHADQTLSPETGRILIMEPDSITGDVAGQVLGRSGYRTVCVRSPEKALEAVQDAASAGHPFSLVLLDLDHTGGANAAVRLLEPLRKGAPDMKIIISSGCPDDPLVVSFSKYGFHAVAEKPYSAERLIRTVRSLLS